MAEEKTLENKILVYLTIALVVIGCFIIYRDVFLRSKVYAPFLPEVIHKIDVDYQTLENPKVKELLPLEKILVPEEIGRENPFESY
jgi:predicted ferric reductase